MCRPGKPLILLLEEESDAPPNRSDRQTASAPWGQPTAGDRLTSGDVGPPSDKPRLHSHPDCRSILTLIAARHLSRTLRAAAAPGGGKGGCHTRCASRSWPSWRACARRAVQGQPVNRPTHLRGNKLTVARRRDQPALRGIGLVALQLLLAALSSWRFNLLNVLAAGIIAGLALTWHRAT
jgi:hypothetical protein